MIIQCSSCEAKYNYDESRFDGKAAKRIKCAKCQNVFEIQNPSAQAQRVATTTDRHDSTQIGKTKKPELPPEPAPAEEKPPTGAHASIGMPAGKRLSLAIIDGPDAGNVIRVEKARITIGRSGADITLNDSEASRQHAALEVRDTSYRVVDLGSTNGTLVNGQKITEPAELTDKGEFQIGATTLMLIVTDDN